LGIVWAIVDGAGVEEYFAEVMGGEELVQLSVMGRFKPLRMSDFYAELHGGFGDVEQFLEKVL
jgi:hypothetical protein